MALATSKRRETSRVSTSCRTSDSVCLLHPLTLTSVCCRVSLLLSVVTEWVQSASRLLGTHAPRRSASPHPVLPTAHRAVRPPTEHRRYNARCPWSLTRSTNTYPVRAGGARWCRPAPTDSADRTPLAAWSPGHFPRWRLLAPGGPAERSPRTHAAHHVLSHTQLKRS